LKKSRPTKESDSYALGMMIYEVLSGQTPFAPYSAPVIIRKVLNGERPERPQGSGGKLFTDSIWRVVELCWKPQPRDRINAKDILLGLEGNPTPLRPSSITDGAETDGDDRSDAVASDFGIFYLSDPRLIFNHSCVLIGVPIVRGDSRLPVSRQTRKSKGELVRGLIRKMRDGGQSPVPPQRRNSRGERVRGLVQKIPKTIIKSLSGLGRAILPSALLAWVNQAGREDS
jgi:serine/threonine protein kinase